MRGVELDDVVPRTLTAFLRVDALYASKSERVRLHVVALDAQPVRVLYGYTIRVEAFLLHFTPERFEMRPLGSVLVAIDFDGQCSVNDAKPIQHKVERSKFSPTVRRM